MTLPVGGSLAHLTDEGSGALATSLLSWKVAELTQNWASPQSHRAYVMGCTQAGRPPAREAPSPHVQQETGP